MVTKNTKVFFAGFIYGHCISITNFNIVLSVEFPWKLQLWGKFDHREKNKDLTRKLKSTDIRWTYQCTFLFYLKRKLMYKW